MSGSADGGAVLCPGPDHLRHHRQPGVPGPHLTWWAWPTDWRARPLPTGSNTQRVQWIGGSGNRRPLPRRASATSRCCCRSGTPPATGAKRFRGWWLSTEICETAGQRPSRGSCRIGECRPWTPIPGLRASLSCITSAPSLVTQWQPILGPSGLRSGAGSTLKLYSKADFRVGQRSDQEAGAQRGRAGCCEG